MRAGSTRSPELQTVTTLDDDAFITVHQLNTNTGQYEPRKIKVDALLGGGSSMTAGSIPFVASDGKLTQDNANLFWDDTNNRLGLGVASGLLFDVNFGGDATRRIYGGTRSGDNAASVFALRAGAALVGTATDKAGGELRLEPGTGTGTGRSFVSIYANIPTSTGTSAGTLGEAFVFDEVMARPSTTRPALNVAHGLSTTNTQVTAAATKTLTVGTDRQIQFFDFAAGGGAYTYNIDLLLSTTGLIHGANFRLVITKAASTNPTIVLRNGSGGSTIYSLNNGNAEVRTIDLLYNGSAWVRTLNTVWDA